MCIRNMREENCSGAKIGWSAGTVIVEGTRNEARSVAPYRRVGVAGFLFSEGWNDETHGIFPTIRRHFRGRPRQRPLLRRQSRYLYGSDRWKHTDGFAQDPQQSSDCNNKTSPIHHSCDKEGRARKLQCSHNNPLATLAATLQLSPATDG